MSDTSEKVYVGIDVSKKHLDLYAAGKSRRFARDKAGLEALCAFVLETAGADALVVLEPTGGYEIVALEALSEAAIAWSRPHPRRVRQYARATGQEAKNDKIDARVLAAFGESFKPPAQRLAGDSQRELSALATRHEQLVGMRTMEKTHAEHVVDPWIRKRLQASLRRLDKEIESVLKRIGALVESQPQMKAKAEAMTQVKGIGKVTAFALLAAMPELGSLSRGEAASLAGLAPVTRQSGQWKGRCFMGKGRQAATRALYMASLSAARFNEQLKPFYKRLREAGKPPKVALCAVARKLIVALNAILKKLPQTA